jgi:hypothetical protein
MHRSANPPPDSRSFLPAPPSVYRDTPIGPGWAGQSAIDALARAATTVLGRSHSSSSMTLHEGPSDVCDGPIPEYCFRDASDLEYRDH